MIAGERQIILRICGTLPEYGGVPVNLLADKLRGIQRLIYNIGTTLVGGGRRGAYRTEVLQACSLVFIETQPGSLQAIMAVPESGRLPIPDIDIGVVSLVKTHDTLQAIKDQNVSFFEKNYPDIGQRVRVLKSASVLLPEEESEYDVAIGVSSGDVILSSSVRPRLDALSRQELQTPVATGIQEITGKLYRIEVETGERQIGIIYNNRKIPCFYSKDYEDVVRDLIPGSLVEVEGLATLNQLGEVDKIEEIIDARSVQLVPLTWTRVIYGNQVVTLREPIQLEVRYEEGLWIYEFSPLGIIGYGSTRSEAIDNFRIDFMASWDLIASEADDNLTLDAIELKQKLLSIVKSVNELP